MIDDDWQPLLEVPTRKVSEYLLNATHPRGASKAKFFLRFGFEIHRPDALAEALLTHAVDARCEIRASIDGDRRTMVVEGPLSTPDGRDPSIRSVWQCVGGLAWRLVTAYPLT